MILWERDQVRVEDRKDVHGLTSQISVTVSKTTRDFPYRGSRRRNQILTFVPHVVAGALQDAATKDEDWVSKLEALVPKKSKKVAG